MKRKPHDDAVRIHYEDLEDLEETSPEQMRRVVGGVTSTTAKQHLTQQNVTGRTASFLNNIAAVDGSAAAAEAGSILNRLENDNASSASFESTAVTNHELRHDLETDISAMAAFPNGFNAASAAGVISDIEEKTGISNALTEKHAETQVENDVAKYGAFDTTTGFGSDVSNLHSLIAGTTGAAQDSESQLISQVEGQMGLTAAKQLEANVVNQVASDAANLHVSAGAPTASILSEYANAIEFANPNITASHLQKDLVRAVEMQDGVGEAQIVSNLEQSGASQAQAESAASTIQGAETQILQDAAKYGSLESTGLQGEQQLAQALFTAGGLTAQLENDYTEGRYSNMGQNAFGFVAANGEGATERQLVREFEGQQGLHQAKEIANDVITQVKQDGTAAGVAGNFDYPTAATLAKYASEIDMAMQPNLTKAQFEEELVQVIENHDGITQQQVVNQVVQNVAAQAGESGETSATQLVQNVINQVKGDGAAVGVNTSTTVASLSGYVSALVSANPNITASQLQSELVRAVENGDGITEAQMIQAIHNDYKTADTNSSDPQYSHKTWNYLVGSGIIEAQIENAISQEGGLQVLNSRTAEEKFIEQSIENQDGITAAINANASAPKVETDGSSTGNDYNNAKNDYNTADTYVNDHPALKYSIDVALVGGALAAAIGTDGAAAPALEDALADVGAGEEGATAAEEGENIASDVAEEIGVEGDAEAGVSRVRAGSEFMTQFMEQAGLRASNFINDGAYPLTRDFAPNYARDLLSGRPMIEFSQEAQNAFDEAEAVRLQNRMLDDQLQMDALENLAKEGATNTLAEAESVQSTLATTSESAASTITVDAGKVEGALANTGESIASSAENTGEDILNGLGL
ncbi:MAG: hypothetical protein K2W95_14010 [Candidatus Obscuribacterales bacterium]|nr:hypothetical protein [Candidatus Obscuribacterales bacterium]